MRLLIVEDDAALSRILVDGFSEHRIDVSLARSVREGRERAELGSHDVIVLDILLPDGSGVDLCASLRARRLDVPILMLTARDAVDDRVRGLEAGADDYLTKPFAFRELLARVHALARRPPIRSPEVLRVADVELDRTARTAARGGVPIPLTAKEFALLEFFVLNAGRAVTRADITAYVWDENHDPFTNVLEVLVRRLRRKLDDPHEVKLIQTLRGAGYRFAG
ncbi:MAG TPA: response regulator transcription factor [Gemmatimonadaceae bacterium]|nr:response regulator transcription factor [Gemmatimonadaceae bacterium]